MNVTTHHTCGLVPAPRPSLISPQPPALSPDPGLAPYLSRAQAKGPGQGPRPKAELRKCRGTHGDDRLCATALGAPSDSPARRSLHGHCQGDFPTGQTTCVGFLQRFPWKTDGFLTCDFRGRTAGSSHTRAPLHAPPAGQVTAEHSIAIRGPRIQSPSTCSRRAVPRHQELSVRSSW